MLIPEEYLCRDCGWVIDSEEHELGCPANKINEVVEKADVKEMND